jgi:hypothetical protein
VGKRAPAFSTCRLRLCSGGKSHTLSATILSSVFPVLRHCKVCLAMLANNRVPGSGACCATH